MVRPGQVVKCPFWMARRSVETTGLNRVPCRNAARSDLVALERRALEACLGKETGALVVTEAGGSIGAKGMCHKPLGVRGP